MSASANSRRSVLKSLAAVSGLAAASVVVPGTAAASPAHRAPGKAKPTVVLVHGAWADGSSWNGVVTRLQRLGYTTVVLANPLRGLLIDANYIRDYLSTLTGPIVLVGHSYGGAVITNAATGLPNVVALVYVDAFAPDQGETVLGLASALPGSALAVDPTTVFKFVPYPNAPAGDVDLYVLPSVFPGAFANDLPARTGALLAASQRAFAFSAGNQPSGVPAWKTIPSWYLLGTIDKVIPPAEQRAMATRAKAHTVEIRASHLSMISNPDIAADLIEQAAQATA
jgi:pimeloyl-ACP methyl ester carboxylesterase